MHVIEAQIFFPLRWLVMTINELVWKLGVLTKNCFWLNSGSKNIYLSLRHCIPPTLVSSESKISYVCLVYSSSFSICVLLCSIYFMVLFNSWFFYESSLYLCSVSLSFSDILYFAVYKTFILWSSSLFYFCYYLASSDSDPSAYSAFICWIWASHDTRISCISVWCFSRISLIFSLCKLYICSLSRFSFVSYC